MAKNWMAYEAAQVIYGENIEDIKDVGSRYPLFTRTVSMLNSEYVLDLLSAIPKVTARVIETGLTNGVVEDAEEEKETTKKEDKPVTKKAEKKEEKKETKKKASKKDETAEGDYESMNNTDLYQLCCERGVSGKLKSRKKSELVRVLKESDAGKYDSVEDTDDDWEDDEEETTTNPYDGKSAKELFNMCKERGIKVKTKQKADEYIKLLIEDDEAEAEVEEDEDEDDDWEI